MALPNCEVWSTLEDCKNRLNKDKVQYTLTKIGLVKTYQMFKNGNEKISCPQEVPLYKLVYGERILLEKLIRNANGEGQDMIVSEGFDLIDEPKDWKIEEDAEFEDDSEEINEWNKLHPELAEELALQEG